MTVARSNIVLLGTDETTGITIANNAGATGTITDVLGDDTSMGYANIYCVFTSTVTAGSLDIEIVNHRVQTVDYLQATLQKFSYAPINGVQRIFIGSVQIARFVSGRIYNNATAANATAVFLALELFKVT